MGKIICPQCGNEISNESGVTVAFCTNCGENVKLPPTEAKTNSLADETAPKPPKTKNALPTILLTSFFTALFLFLLLAGGTYWFVNQKVINWVPIEPSKVNQTKPTPRVKTRSAVAATEITSIEFSHLTSTTRASAAQFFGNVNPNNHTTRSGSVSFSRDGKAVKINNQLSNINGVQVSTTPNLLTGRVTSEQFATLAEVFVENDFLNEPDSKTSTSLPINYTLTIFYSTGKKQIKTSNSGSDTPEAEAMLQAFKNLENQVSWKPQ
jgi:hypothetical protein